MTPRELIDAFEVVAEAPDGVKRLRELVLQLSVRGKLVPQEPGDEPASVLLERIAAEKARLVKAGKVRQAEALPPVKAAEVPFEVPESWVWSRLAGLATRIQYGYTASANEDSARCRLLRITDIQNNYVNWETVPGCEIGDDELAKFVLADGDIVVARTGGTVGKTYRVAGLGSLNAVFASYLIRVAPPASIDGAYLKLALETPLYWAQLVDRTAGTGQPNVSASSLATLVLPLPPLAEQHRIVARVDELMGLLDGLEAARKDRDATRDAARDSALAALRDADTLDDVEVAWNRIAERMPELFTRPADLEPLRQAVLQLAVRGRLVRQDPNDEPASVLLERIAAEKARVVKDGTIRRADALPSSRPAAKDHWPFHWRSAGLGDLVLGTDAGWSPNCPATPTTSESEWGVLKTTSVQPNRYLPQHHKALAKGFEPRPSFEVRAGDLLVTRAGPFFRVGVAAYVCETRKRLMLSDKIIRCSLLDTGADGQWVALCINTGESAAFLRESQTGMDAAQVNISQARLAATPIPIPPLAEQHRIVAKVDALMALIDQLEARLTAATDLHAQFAAAAVHHLDA